MPFINGEKMLKVNLNQASSKAQIKLSTGKSLSIVPRINQKHSSQQLSQINLNEEMLQKTNKIKSQKQISNQDLSFVQESDVNHKIEEDESSALTNTSQSEFQGNLEERFLPELVKAKKKPKVRQNISALNTIGRISG